MVYWLERRAPTRNKEHSKAVYMAKGLYKHEKTQVSTLMNDGGGQQNGLTVYGERKEKWGSTEVFGGGHISP